MLVADGVDTLVTATNVKTLLEGVHPGVYLEGAISVACVGTCARRSGCRAHFWMGGADSVGGVCAHAGVVLVSVFLVSLPSLEKEEEGDAAGYSDEGKDANDYSYYCACV